MPLALLPRMASACFPNPGHRRISTPVIASGPETPTALHHIPNGEVWTIEEIEKRKAEIEAAGLTWSVVESVPISEDIKTRGGAWQRHIDAYKQTVRNLAKCGINIVCYNFMPVIDWTRTDLAYRLPDGALALRFDATEFAAFDLFILKREGAENDWPPERVEKARAVYEAMDENARDQLTRNIIAGLPGTEESYTLDMFRKALARYADIDAEGLRANFSTFIRPVSEAADEAGVLLGCHPDDPPRPLLGLPRVFSTAADVRWLLQQAGTPSNGVTFCTGRLASGRTTTCRRWPGSSPRASTSSTSVARGARRIRIASTRHRISMATSTWSP